jgi:hypothetical protein
MHSEGDDQAIQRELLICKRALLHPPSVFCAWRFPVLSRPMCSTDSIYAVPLARQGARGTFQGAVFVP